MKKYILILLLLAGCTKSSTDSPGPCTGNSGNTLSCSVGSCSHSGGAGCSTPVDGVYCCNGSGGGSTSNDGTNRCSLGYCWTRENICCPRSAPYPCNGSCYSSNVCNYTSLTTACHDW